MLVQLPAELIHVNIKFQLIVNLFTLVLEPALIS